MEIKAQSIALVYGGITLLLVLVVYISGLSFVGTPEGGVLGNNQQYTVTLYQADQSEDREHNTTQSSEASKKAEQPDTDNQSIQASAEPIVKQQKTSAQPEKVQKKDVQTFEKDLQLVKGGSKEGLGGSAQASPTYQQEVLIYLQRYRYYPPLALRRHISGTVQVDLTLACNGQVKHYQIAKSSGHDMLDNAAIKMINDAGQFPASKACVSLTTMTLPISFKVV